MDVVRFAPRILLTLALVSTLLPWTLGPATPALADAPDARDPDRRIVIVLKSVYVSDDHDWGTGEMLARMRLFRTNDGCSPGQVDPPSCETRLAISTIDFAANDGDNVTVEGALPGTGPDASVADPSIIGPEIGIPVWNHQLYRFSLRVDEQDAFEDPLGIADAVLSASNGWLLGAHTARGMVYGEPGQPGDFSAEYEIRDAPLPDLRPVGIKVNDLPNTNKRQVCVPVQNSGVVDVNAYQVEIQVNGVTPPEGKVTAGLVGSGNYHEVCSLMVLPTGQVALSAIVDGPRAVTEVSETNNRFDRGYLATRVGDVQGPLGPAPGGGSTGSKVDEADTSSSGARADLTVGAVKVNGEVPDGKDDCKDGKSPVVVVVKNTSAANAGPFVVRLAVDGDTSVEASVDGVEAGKEREVRFENVRLRKGEQKLTATVDAKGVIAESNEDDNGRDVTARCRDHEHD